MKMPLHVILSAAIVAGCGISNMAQEPMGQMDHSMHDMPGMQHNAAPQAQKGAREGDANHENGLLQEPENPARRSGSADSSVPELLKEVATRKPLALMDFEAMAATHNPTLKQAEAGIMRAEGQAKQAGLWPNLQMGYQGEQIRGGSFGGGEQGGFLQQTIPLGNKRGLEKEIYKQQANVAQTGLEEQRQRVLADVRHDFYEALAAQAEVEVRRGLLSVALDASMTVHQLANVGQADAPDILQTEVEAEQAKLDYAVAQRMYLKRYAMLSAMAGMPEMAATPLVGNLYADPEVDVASITAQMASVSPTVRRADQEIAVAQSEVASAKRQIVPDLTLKAGAQYNGSQVAQTPVKAAGVQSFASATIGIPLWNRNQGNVQAARAETVRAQAEAQRVRLALARSAQPAVEEYQAAQLQAERYRTELLPRAQRAYELYRTKYNAMAAAYPQVLVSQRTYFQLRIGYIEALRSVWSNAIALKSAMLTGGLDTPAGTAVSRSAINSATAGGGVE